MRINGSGTGGGSFGGGGGGSRSDSFRRRHRVGQNVRGALLKNLPDSMAWVEIDGDRLLAQLEITRPEGSRLLFLIKQLTPDIVLKEIPATQSGGMDALGLASAFDAARTLFENRFRARLHDSGRSGSPIDLADFLKLLAQNPDLFAGYMDAANCARSISAVMEANRKGRVLYQPWLAPDSLRQATFIRASDSTSQLTETIVEFDHVTMGLVRVQFLHKGGTLACKLKMQHPMHDKALMQYLGNRKYTVHDLEIQHLGITRLPRGSHGGILAEMLFKA